MQVNEAEGTVASNVVETKPTSELKAAPPELDDVEALDLLEGVENDCPCTLAADSREMCREGKCYHRTGQGLCGECAGGFGITVEGMLRAGFNAGYKRALADGQAAASISAKVSNRKGHVPRSESEGSPVRQPGRYYGD